MSENRKTENWEELIVRLLDFDLIPESTEEAEAALNEMGISASDVKAKSLQIFAGLLGEFPDNWRSSLRNGRANVDIDAIPLKLSLSVNQLKERLVLVLDKLAGGNHTTAPTMVGFRNLTNLDHHSLAILLRQIEFVALESGIKIEEET